MTEAPFAGRATIALMPSANTFAAALLLMASDHAKQRRHRSVAQRGLFRRPSMDDETFLTPFPSSERELALLVRSQIGAFFDVPPTTIHPTDELERDYHFSTFEPFFHAFVTTNVLVQYGLATPSFSFNTNGLRSLVDLTHEIANVVANAMARASKNGG